MRLLPVIFLISESFSQCSTMDRQPVLSNIKIPLISLWDEAIIINDLVDEMLKKYLPLLKDYGFDPMALPEIVEGFEVKVIFITYNSWLKTHQGYMTGLMNIATAGNQTIQFYTNMIGVHLEFKVINLQFVYKYLVQVMGIGLSGGIVGTLNSLNIEIDVLADLDKDELHLQQFQFKNIGRLRIQLTKNVLTDWLANPVIGVFVSIFDTVIIKFVEVNMRAAIENHLVEINIILKDALLAFV